MMDSSGLTKELTISFRELKNFDIDDVVLCLSKEDAMEICNKSHEQGNASVAEILRLWLNKLIRAYESTNLNATDWQILFKFLRGFIELLIPRVTSEQNIELSHCTIFLNDILEFTVYLKHIISKTKMPVGCTFCQFLLDIVMDFLKFEENFEDTEQLCEIVNLVNELLDLSLNVISCIIEAFKETLEDQQLINLLPQLCSIGMCMQPLTMTVVIKNWKTVTRICILYMRFKGKTPIWLTQPLKYLINEVTENVNMLLGEDTHTEAIDKIDKFMRVTNFYLKLLGNIFRTDVRQIEAPVIQMLYKVLARTYCIPVSLMSTNIPTMLENYVRTEMLILVELVYQDNLFCEFFQEHLCQLKSKSDCFQFYVDILKIAIKSKPDRRDNTYCVLTKLFPVWTRDIHIFLKTAHYNQLIEYSAALTVVSTNSTLKKFFRKGVLANDINLAHACTDVIIVFASICETTLEDKVLKQEYDYWQHINDCFALFSTNHKQNNVQRLLRHYFKICYAKDALRSYLIDKEFKLNKFRILQCVHLDNAKTAYDLILRLCDFTSVPTAPVKNYEMLAYMELLATLPHSIVKELPIERLNPLLVKLFHCTNANVFARFIDAFFKCLGKTEISKQIFVLSELIAKNCIVTQVKSWHIQKLLQQLTKDGNIGSEILKLTIEATSRDTSGVFVKKITCVSKTTRLKEIHLQELNLSRHNTHACMENICVKRQRVEEPLKVLIGDVVDRLQKYMECTDQFDVNDHRTLSNALQTVQNILLKNN